MNVNEPKITLNIIAAQLLAGVTAQKVLIVAQKLAGGTAVSGELQSDIPDDNSENTLFGRRAHAAGMVRQFKKLNKIVQLDAISLDDAGAAVKATSIFTITGPATEDGTLTFSVGSERNHIYEVDVLSGDTATVIGDALAALQAADLDAPYTSANVAGVVTNTAENGGTIANEWGLKVTGSVAGVAVALTGWTGGATDPTLTSLFDVIGNTRYQTIIWPVAYTDTELTTLLDARFNDANEVLDGVGVMTKVDTLANLKTFAGQNSQSIVVLGDKAVARTAQDGAATMEMSDIVSAEFGAFRALRYTDDASLTQFLTTTAPADQFGGIGIGALPYFNTSMPNLAIATATDGFSFEDQDELNNNGVGLFGPNRAFNGTILGEIVTTYLTDVAGNPDASFRNLETVDTSSLIREFYFENYRKRYAQTRLTGGDLIAGKDMVNEASFRAFTNELYDELAEAALVEAGSAAKKDFNDNLSIVASVSAGSITVNMAPLQVGQLRLVIGTIQVNFSS